MISPSNIFQYAFLLPIYVHYHMRKKSYHNLLGVQKAWIGKREERYFKQNWSVQRRYFYLFFHSFNSLSFIHSFIYLLICEFVYSFIYVFIHSFIYSFIQLCIYLFIYGSLLTFDFAEIQLDLFHREIDMERRNLFPEYQQMLDQEKMAIHNRLEEKDLVNSHFKNIEAKEHPCSCFNFNGPTKVLFWKSLRNNSQSEPHQHLSSP